MNDHENRKINPRKREKQTSFEEKGAIEREKERGERDGKTKEAQEEYGFLYL